MLIYTFEHDSIRGAVLKNMDKLKRMRDPKYNGVIGISETLYKDHKPYILLNPWRILEYISIGRFK